MTLTIGSFTTSKLLAQPFGYDETDTSAGLTAQRWSVSGLLTTTEWAALLAEYDSWRDARIDDEDTLLSGVVGTTVALTASANGLSWTAVPCWFTQAPSGEQAGAYIQASVQLVDAAQQLQVLLAEKQKAKEKSDADIPALGTVTLGSAELTLVAPMETYQDVPQLQLTAGGVHYINGPLTATRVRRIEGTTDSTGWSAVRSWFETTVESLPATGSWYPLTAPTASAEAVIEAGVKTTRYTVSIEVGEVK